MTAGNRLVVHECLVKPIQEVARVDIADAECIGILDIDLLDSISMTRLSNEFAGQESPAGILDVYGEPVKEHCWREVIPYTRTPYDTVPDMADTINLDFLDYYKRHDSARYGRMHIGYLPTRPWSLAELNEYGLIFAQVFIMSPRVARLLECVLSEPFWLTSYWTTAGGPDVA